jgi:hypothetical protein
LIIEFFCIETIGPSSFPFTSAFRWRNPSSGRFFRSYPAHVHRVEHHLFMECANCQERRRANFPTLLLPYPTGSSWPVAVIELMGLVQVKLTG